MVTIDLLILTCLTPEVTKVSFQTFFCKMLKTKIEPYSIYSIVDEVLYVAKCNLGKVKIHPMLGSSFAKFVSVCVCMCVGGGGEGSAGAYAPVHVCAFCFTEACFACTVCFPFPTITSVIGK